MKLNPFEDFQIDINKNHPTRRCKGPASSAVFRSSALFAKLTGKPKLVAANLAGP
jgi:hypothetical protein